MTEELLEQTIDTARQAGVAVMEIYRSGEFDVTTKNDDGRLSPLTKADKTAHDMIETGLKRISDYPVVSEEGEHGAGDGETFWLVDPIDGTKEFINKNGEFTINIGLIKNGNPVLGVVYAPAKKVMYFATVGSGAYKQEDGKQPVNIRAEYDGKVPTVVVSRSHLNDDTRKYLDGIGEHKKASMGSSLKLCLVAEGAASVYPRFAPTSLWDTAAADAVVRAAGGRVVDKDGSELTYRPEKSILNPHFIAKTKNWPD